MSNTKKKFRPTVSYTNKSGQSTTFEAPKYRLIKRKIKSYIGESADGVVNVTRYRRGQDGVYQESWQLNPTNHKLRAVVSGNFTNQSSSVSATSTPITQSSPTTSQQSTPPSSAYSTAVPQNNVRQITSTTNNTTIPNNV